MQYIKEYKNKTLIYFMLGLKRIRDPESVAVHSNPSEKSGLSESTTQKQKVFRGINYEKEKETDSLRLQQRLKQISFGKNTMGYDNYLTAVPKHKRGREHPRTPDPTEKQVL